MDLIVYSSLISRTIILHELKQKLQTRENKRKVLFSLLINTHCAGCGRFNYVCFWGYCGEYCAKGCWKRFHDTWDSVYDEEDSCRLWWIYEKYNDLENVNLTSKARKWRAKRPADKRRELISNALKSIMTYTNIFNV